MMYIEDQVIYKGSLINNGLKINKKYIVTDIYDLSGNFKYIRLSVIYGLYSMEYFYTLKEIRKTKLNKICLNK